MKAVEVIWLDSGLQVHPEDWTPVAALVARHKLSVVKTAGYLAAQDENAYYIVGTYDPKDMQGLNMTIIAKENVRHIYYTERGANVRPD